MSGPVRILHVDDDPGFAELTVSLLAREDDRFVVDSATDARDGLAMLDGTVDCVVSDYDMPGRNGVEFLRLVRETRPELPFILFTGKGSEEVASEAIAAGVTDYLQKGGGTEQFAILANRIVNATDRASAERDRDRHLEAIESVREGISILDGEGRFVYVNEVYAELYGYAPADLLGEHWALLYPDEELEFAHEVILRTVEAEGSWQGESTGLRADGSVFREDHVVARTSRGDLVCTVRECRESEPESDTGAGSA